ncbi:hypothetical protein ACU635_28960 [[Actinomadura] parvosata]|uniref:hypothetical protein n=1 Tax=[Actinomadura] parvosata TaxID=1955412 RepID=UPI00406C681A
MTGRGAVGIRVETGRPPLPRSRASWHLRANTIVIAWLALTVATAPAGAPDGVQVLDLAPAQGGFAELVFPEAGSCPVVDHAMRRAEAGAHGLFQMK